MPILFPAGQYVAYITGAELRSAKPDFLPSNCLAENLNRIKVESTGGTLENLQIKSVSCEKQLDCRQIRCPLHIRGERLI